MAHFRFVTLMFFGLLMFSIEASACVPRENLQSGLNNVPATCFSNPATDYQHNIGFAQSARGGLYAQQVYSVSNLNDSGPGSLRDALSYSDVYVVFGVSGTIQLNQDVRIQGTSRVTIDGRESSIRITDHGLLILDASDVVVRDLTIEDGLSQSRDAIGIARSNLIWIDSVTLSNFADGLLDVTRAPVGKTRVNISRSLFKNHGKVMILGLHSQNAPGDRHIYATVRESVFISIDRRTPRVSQGYAHMINNVISWRSSAAEAYENSRLLMEGNWLISTDSTSLPVKHSLAGYPDGRVRGTSAGLRRNMNMAGSQPVLEHNPSKVGNPWYSYTVEESDYCMLLVITSRAGAGRWGNTNPIACL